jgi:hypothetical protein
MHRSGVLPDHETQHRLPHAQVLVFLEQLRAPLAMTDPARAAFDLVIARVTSSATTTSSP